MAQQGGNLVESRKYLERAVFFFNGATRISANGESYNDWASSMLQLADPGATNYQTRFYRIVESW